MTTGDPTLDLLSQITTPFDLVNTLWGIVMPLLVAVATNKGASPNLKAALLVGFGILGSLVTTATLTLPGVGWSGFLTAFGQAMTAAIVAHFGFWKKGLGDLLAQYTAKFGIGGAVQGNRSSAQPAPGSGPRDTDTNPGGRL